MTTTAEILAMADNLEANTFVRVSLEDSPHRYYPTTLTAEAAALLRKLAEDREKPFLPRDTSRFRKWAPEDEPNIPDSAPSVLEVKTSLQMIEDARPFK